MTAAKIRLSTGRVSLRPKLSLHLDSFALNRSPLRPFILAHFHFTILQPRIFVAFLFTFVLAYCLPVSLALNLDTSVVVMTISRVCRPALTFLISRIRQRLICFYSLDFVIRVYFRLSLSLFLSSPLSPGRFARSLALSRCLRVTNYSR